MSRQLFTLSEQLESRILLAFASLNSRGILSVVGTSKNNAIVIDISGSNVRAKLDGLTLNFNKSAVKGIWVNAFNGDDKIQNKTSLPSTLIGAGGRDSLTGGSSDDNLDGAEGPDTFFSSAGHDSIAAGDGPDTVDFSNQSVVTIKFLGGGGNHMNIDTGFGMISTFGNDNLRVNGTAGDDTFNGPVSDAVIVDGAGGDDYFNVWTYEQIAPTVYGSAGNDTIYADNNSIPEFAYGGSGDDLWIGNERGFGLFLDGGPGIDTQRDDTDDRPGSATFIQVMSPGVEIAIGSVFDGITGNELNNTIIGGSGPETLRGGGGNDLILGNGGDDEIFGDEGNDTLDGGDGVDTIDAGTGIDHLTGGGGGEPESPLANKLIPHGSDDVIDYSGEAPGTFTGEDQDPSVNYLVHYRNDTATDEIVRDDPFTVLLTSGDDTFFARGAFTDFTIQLGDGDDKFFAAAASVTRVEAGNGNDFININNESAIREVILGAGNDTLNDEYGGKLVALVDGGSGKDRWDIDPDDEQQATPYRKDLGPGLENLTLATRSRHVTVYGNGLNNVITIISDGINEVHGGSGNDRIIASAFEGRSSVWGDSGNDVFINSVNGNGAGAHFFSGGSGNDTVDYSASTSMVSITLDNKANDGTEFDSLDEGSAFPTSGIPSDDIRSDVETLIGGSAGDYLQGGPFAERFIGNGGNDTIWAGGGNDTLDGGSGRDSLSGQGGNDTFFAKDGEKDSLVGGGGTDKARRDNSSSVKDSVLSIESFI